MIVAGFGFRESATLSSLRQALFAAESLYDIDAVATLAEKSGALQALGMPIIDVTRDAAKAQVTLTQSKASFAAYGLGSVAEATALAAAGPGARLLGPRVISDDRLATCALAEGGSQ